MHFLRTGVNANLRKMDHERFKEFKTRLDSLLGLQTSSTAAALSSRNGSDREPEPSSAIAIIRQGSSTSSSVAISDSEKQIQNDESLALALLQEEDEITLATTPETIFKEMMHLAEIWVGDIFRKSIGIFSDKSALNAKLNDAYNRVIEYAQVKYRGKCNEEVLALYETWTTKVHRMTVKAKKKTRIMIESMFEKRFGCLEKGLCREWCITYTSIEQVRNQLMEDDVSEMGLLKSLGIEWINFYNDLKLIKATAIFEVISHLKGYEDALISLVKNDKNDFMGTDFYLNKCNYKTHSLKVPVGLRHGTKQKIADVIDHINLRPHETLKTEEATVAAAVEYTVEQYENTMEKKLAEAKHWTEIDSLADQLKSHIATAFSETGKAGFSYVWNFERMPLKYTLEVKACTFRIALLDRIIREKQDSIEKRKAEKLVKLRVKGTLVQMSFSPGLLGPENQQKPSKSKKEIKNRGIGLFLSKTKIVYLVEGSAQKEEIHKFEIPAPEETAASHFNLYQLLTAETDKISTDINIDGQNIKPYNEVPMAYRLASIRETMQEHFESEQKITDSVIAIAVPANVSSCSRTRLELAMKLAGMGRSLLVQITTSVAVAYIQKPGIPDENHHIAVVHVCDGLIEMAIFQVGQNKCTQLSAGINTTITELTDQCTENFGSTFKALWYDISARAAVQETSVHSMLVIFDKPTAVRTTVQKYSEAIRKQVNNSCRLLFSRDCRPILLGLDSISSFGATLPNSLVEEVCVQKTDNICNPVFGLHHMPPEDVREAQRQLQQLLRSASAQPPFKKLKLGD